MGCCFARPAPPQYVALFPLGACAHCGALDRAVRALALRPTDGEPTGGPESATRRRLEVVGACKTCQAPWAVRVEWDTACACARPLPRLSQLADKYLGVCDACGAGHPGWSVHAARRAAAPRGQRPI